MGLYRLIDAKMIIVATEAFVAGLSGGVAFGAYLPWQGFKICLVGCRVTVIETRCIVRLDVADMARHTAFFIQQTEVSGMGKMNRLLQTFGQTIAMPVHLETAIDYLIH